MYEIKIFTINGLLWGLFTYFIFLIVHIFIKSRIKNDIDLKNKYLIAYHAHFFGGIALALIYTYIYHGIGDNISYYEGVQQIKKGAQENPNFLHDYFNLPKEDLFDLAKNDQKYFYTWPVATARVSMWGYFISLPFGSEYLSLVVIFSSLGFWGCWLIVLALRSHYPNINIKSFYPFFFLPSLLIWGNALMKDTYCIFAFGLFFYHSVMLLQKKAIINLIFMILSLIVLFNFKTYIFVSTIVACYFYYFSLFLANKKINAFFKYALVAFFLVMTIIVSSSVLNSLNNIEDPALARLATENVISEIQLSQDKFAEGGASSFDIGRFDGSGLSLVKIIFPSFITTFFRPFVFESHNATMLISGIENLVVLWFFLAALIKVKVKRYFKTIFSEKILLYVFTYCLIMAILFGITITNFGSLLRYKILVVAMFFFINLILKNEYSANEKSININS